MLKGAKAPPGGALAPWDSWKLKLPPPPPPPKGANGAAAGRAGPRSRPPTPDVTTPLVGEVRASNAAVEAGAGAGTGAGPAAAAARLGLGLWEGCCIALVTLTPPSRPATCKRVFAVGRWVCG